MMIRLFLSIFILAVFIPSNYAYSKKEEGPISKVELKVLVSKDINKIKLRIKGGYNIEGEIRIKILKEGFYLEDMEIYSRDITNSGIKILCSDKTRTYINGRQFRGNIDIMKDKAGSLLVINHIGLEEYLYGVLYHEVSHKWPMEILKAQAIAARTYALYQKLTTTNKLYDLTSDIYSQVYGGRTSETGRTRKAVNLTKGMILTYNDTAFPAYFHATCGGYTTSSKLLWNVDIPPLAGGVCDFCSFSPHYKWKRSFKLEDIEKKLKEAGFDIKISSIEILKRDESGRILDLVVKGKDKEAKLSGNNFRLIIGPNVVRSANFNVIVKGKYIFFEGKGWGHGVGMCQWGAYGMSKHGFSAEGILKYYYPGAKIKILE